MASTTADTIPLDDQRAGAQHVGIAFAKGDALVDRHRFAGEERLVDPQAVRFEQPGVAGHAVAFLDDQVIANHEFLAGDATHHAPAHHGAARARQIAQRLQDALSAQLLVYGDKCDSDDRGSQDDAVADAAEHPIEQGAGEKQQDHRLRQHRQQRRRECLVPRAAAGG